MPINGVRRASQPPRVGAQALDFDSGQIPRAVGARITQGLEQLMPKKYWDVMGVKSEQPASFFVGEARGINFEVQELLFFGIHGSGIQGGLVIVS